MSSGGELHGGGVSGRSGIRLRFPQIEDLSTSSSVLTTLVSTSSLAKIEGAGIEQRSDGRRLRASAQRTIRRVSLCWFRKMNRDRRIGRPRKVNGVLLKPGPIYPRL